MFEPARFSPLEVQAVTIDRDATDAVEAIEGNLAALPIADQVLSMEPAAYGQMIDDVAAQLSDHITDGMLTAPNRAYVAIATR